MDVTDLSHVQLYKNLLEKAKINLKTTSQRKGQKPTKRKSRQELIRTQFALQDRYDGSQDKAQSMQMTYMSHRFPPSVAPLSSLKKIHINDLLLETNHRGSYVLLRTIAPPTKMTAVMSAVEDEKGGCDFLQLYNMSGDRKPKKILPEGQVLIIKEPFYKLNVNGGTGIRVDHVSDVVFLSPYDSRVPLEWQPRIKSIDKTSMDWKEEGNAFFRKKEFYEAIECYTQALNIDPKDTALVKALRLNRSQAFLSAGFHEKALEDAEHVLNILDPADEKASFRAAKSLYQARRFGDCKTRLTALVRRYPGNKEAKADLLKVYKRLQEEQTGKYDFQEMRRLTTSTDKKPVKLDCADFVGPVCLQDTLDSGRGLFTTRDVKFGELLLCSKAFQVSYSVVDGFSICASLLDDRVEQTLGSSMVPEAIQKLYNNPSTSKELLKLYSGNYKSVEERYVDGGPIVDTFLVHEIRRLNSFSCPLLSSASSYIALDNADPRKPKAEVDKDTNGAGIWVMPSYINHSCGGPGMVHRAFIGDMMVVRAMRDIKKGQQIMFPYVRHDKDVKFRQKNSNAHWGFTCNCHLCIIEIQETDAVRKSRDTLLERILAFGSVFDQPNPPNFANVLRKVLPLIKSLEATYKHPPAEQPRYTLGKSLDFLCAIYLQTKDFIEFLVAARRLVAAHGYDMKEDFEQGKILFRGYSHTADASSIPILFVRCSSIYNVSGNFLMAEAYKEAAVDFYEVTYGERASFSEAYGKYFEEFGLSSS